MISAAAAADPRDYDRAHAVASFQGVMRELVHDLKFRDRHDARRLLGRWLAETGADLLSEADAIVPVPLPRGRLFRRPLFAPAKQDRRLVSHAPSAARTFQEHLPCRPIDWRKSQVRSWCSSTP